MNLDDLRLAVIIGQEGSLSAAAIRLGIAPGTLSKALARLERATRVQLFERLPRGMRPTDLGRAFLERAARIDLAAFDLQAQLRDLRQVRAGTLCFGLGNGIPDAWVEPAIGALVDRGVNVELIGGMTDSLRQGVLSGELAFAVFGLSDTPGDGLEWHVLIDDPMQPVAPKAHRLARRGRPVAWRELAEARWVMTGRGTATWHEYVSNFQANHLVAPTPTIISRSSNRERMLAGALDAMLLMPRSAIAEPSVSRRFTPVHPVGGWSSRRVLGIAHREGGYLSPAAQHAMQRLSVDIRRVGDMVVGRASTMKPSR